LHNISATTSINWKILPQVLFNTHHDRRIHQTGTGTTTQRNADAALQNALQLYNDDDDYKALCLYYLGTLHSKQKNYSQAETFLKQSLAIDPDFDECREALQQLKKLKS
jgi:uncharacterized protein HemY